MARAARNASPPSEHMQPSCMSDPGAELSEKGRFTDTARAWVSIPGVIKYRRRGGTISHPSRLTCIRGGAASESTVSEGLSLGLVDVGSPLGDRPSTTGISTGIQTAFRPGFRPAF